MHILGKILAIFVVLAAVGAAMITSKLVVVRNSWTAKNFAAKKKYLETKPKVDELEARVDQSRSEAVRKRDLWGTYWNNVQTAKAAADGSVQVNVGAESGWYPNLLLHGFEVAADGASIYRGSFLAADVRNGGSLLKPNWRVSPEELNTWQFNQPWRWRNTIPSGQSENIDRQLLSILKYEETLGDRRRTLATQSGLLDQANENLKRREDELVGGDTLEKSELVAPEFREGLVAALEQAEEQRNLILEKIDHLRREIREIQRQIEELVKDNNELVGQLPQPEPDAKVTGKK
jgi:hypothetical protein